MRNSAHSEDHPVLLISEFVERAPASLELQLLAGAKGAATRRIEVPRIQKLGLALAGFTNYIHPGRLQIVGQSEISFLSQLEPEKRREAIEKLAPGSIACILITKGLEPPPELLSVAEEAGLPLLQTPVLSSVAINVVTDFLQKVLAPFTVRHGVLLDVYGLGVLIEGASGIGKSECALDLISRGHRLVADDVVEVRCIGAEQLLGSAPELLCEHLEIRGLGIINIGDLFGISSVTSEKEVDMSIRLERWHEGLEVDRLGIDPRFVTILGVNLPQFLIPVSPGRNVSTLVETAVRVQLSRARGYNAAEQFVARHVEVLEASDRQTRDEPPDLATGAERRELPRGRE